MSLLYKLSNEKIYKLGYFLILINAIGAFTSIALTSLSMILGILILFILKFKNKEEKIFTIEQKYILKILKVFLISLFVSVLFSSNIEKSINEYIHFVSSFISLLIGMIFIRNKNQYFNWLIVVSISVVFSDIFSVFQLINGDQATGFVHNRINFGNQCVSAIYLFLIFLINNKINCPQVFKCYFSILTLLTLVILTYSQVRGAWIAFIGTLIVYFVINRNYNKKITMIMFSVLTIFILSIFSNDALLIRFQSILNFQTDYNIKDRLDMYQSAIKMFLDYPIYGIGFGNFREFYLPGSIYLMPNALEFRFPEGYPHAHNTFLTFLAETGLLGTIGLVIFFGSILLLFYRRYKKNNNDFIALTGFCILTGFIFSSLTDNVYGESMFIRFSMISIGICLADIEE